MYKCKRCGRVYDCWLAICGCGGYLTIEKQAGQGQSKESKVEKNK